MNLEQLFGIKKRRGITDGVGPVPLGGRSPLEKDDQWLADAEVAPEEQSFETQNGLPAGLRRMFGVDTAGSAEGEAAIAEQGAEPNEESLITRPLGATPATRPIGNANATGASDSYEATGFPEAPKTASQKAREAMETEAPAKRERRLGRRIGSGLWNGFKAWGAAGAPGGLAGLGGALATGGIAFGASPETHQKFKTQQRQGELMGEYERKLGQETASAKRDLEQARVNDQTMETALRVDKANRDELERQQQERKQLQSLFQFVYQQSPNFDPADPKNASIVEGMKRAGVPVFEKRADGKLEFKQLPDGTAGTFDRRPVTFKRSAHMASLRGTNLKMFRQAALA